jgi:hypothetical protein
MGFVIPQPYKIEGLIAIMDGYGVHPIHVVEAQVTLGIG